MVSRTIRKYSVEVGRWVRVDGTHMELATSDIFECEFVGKPTETELRKAGKLQGVKCGKGYVVNATEIETRKYVMDDATFMQYATLVEEDGEDEED